MKRLISLVICFLVAGQCAMFVFAASFTDVASDAYYASAVEWAVANGITAGKTETTFAPNESCTRAQAVSFMHRAAGNPLVDGTNQPFTDVKPADYFATPVQWALENGITAGVSADKFGPHNPCTRGQIVSFLYRAAGSPDIGAVANPFKDVKEADYFYKAVLWAVENGITAGMSADKFAPNNKCTRGQIVCFLERYYNKNDLRIVIQPADFYMEYSEVDATFTVEIEGGAPNYYYEWYVEGEKKATHGATSATSDSFIYHVTDYDFDNVQGSYLDVICVVTDIKGTEVTSITAKLYKKEATKPLEITKQPKDYQMTSSMEEATFTIGIKGGEPNYYYDWYVEGEKKATHGATSATSDSFTYQVSDYDFDYVQGSYLDVVCYVTDIKGTQVSSVTAKLYKKEMAKPLAITSQPVNYQMTSSMEEATFTVEVEGGARNYLYEWSIVKDGTVTDVVAHGITSATSDTLTYVFSDYDFDDYRDIEVYCVITDKEGYKVTTETVEVLQK
ncbi:MAG: S-layer homology domain-containing protein [Clostridia bacterium]|nr:S-layer homology domain-containing protein [Clostridia bacterium]